MPFSISAAFPLGTYRGAAQDGRAEPVPSVSRLFSALLSAAGFGPRAHFDGHAWGPSDADALALRWIEAHPPDAVTIPALHLNAGRVSAYREDGTVKKSPAGLRIKKFPKPPDASCAVGGRFSWTWTQEPPPPVADALRELCADVGYLGSTESPVRLQVNAQAGDPTHRLDAEADLFAAGGRDLEVPTPGRLGELMTAHTDAHVVPTSSRDKVGSDEWSSSPVPVREAVATARYAPVAEPLPEAPWAQVILVPVDRAVPESQRVTAAVAAHRALIALIGYGAPPLVTGAYPDGVAPPANRLALHWVDARMPLELRGAPGALALFVPQGADPADLAVLARAVPNLRSVRRSGGREPLRVTAQAWTVPGVGMWEPPPAGAVRLWTTSPPAIPDVRGTRDGKEWTFADAALLSLGFILREYLGPVAGRGDARYRAIVEAVTARGGHVADVRAVRDSDVGRYVHKINKHAVVRPYRAWLGLGDLVGEQTVLAIGQSRHLGGGLLTPVDIPAQPRPTGDADAAQAQ